LPDRRFTLTPLDLIVLFVALVIPNLPGLGGMPEGSANAIAKVVVFFYAIELLANRAPEGALWFRLSALAVTIALIGRGWLGTLLSHGTVMPPS